MLFTDRSVESGNHGQRSVELCLVSYYRYFFQASSLALRQRLLVLIFDHLLGLASTHGRRIP